MSTYLMLAAVLGLFLLIRWILRRFRVRNYADKYVFITGCDTGFGNLLAKRLDRFGINVFAGCLTSDGANVLRETCSKRLNTLNLDVTNEESIAKAKLFVEKRLPKGKGLWAVVNNAGVSGVVAPIEWLNTNDFRSVLEINMFGVIFVAKAFLPLVRRERGRIVNMASIMGRFSMSSGPYAASKYAVEGFSDQLRREIYRTGVSVHIIEPGYFRTTIVDEERLREYFQMRYDTADPEVKEYYGKDYLEGLQETTAKLLGLIMSPKIHKVVDAYEHAVLAKFPKPRYVVGLDANILFRLLWHLPEWLSDYLVSRPMPLPQGAL